MRKHDVRKWLHAILDLLPVILIPVFMIYSHRHTIDSGSIQIPQNEVVDFNQLVKNGLPTNTDYWQSLNYGEFEYSSEHFAIVSVGNYSGINQLLNLAPLHTYYLSVELSTDLSTNVIQFGLSDDLNYTYVIPIDNVGTSFTKYDGLLTTPQTLGNNYVFLRGGNNSGLDITFYVRYVNVIDLTQMFGSGNVPTIEQFNQWYSDDYYEYTLSHKELLKGVSTITYSDTDIMSQFTYQLYNSVDKYFNMGNVFHLNEVYDWFNLNIFNGNAPIYIYIVYQIVLYELIMDLLMLLYALFMWFIDMIEKLMDKPLNSVK